MINENVLQGTCKTLPKIALVRKLNWCKLPKVMEDTKSIPPPSAQPDTQIWAGPCYCISFHCCLCPFLNVKEGPHTEERAHTPQVVSLLPYLDYFFMIVVTLIIYWLYGDNNSPRWIHNADINQQSSIKAKLPPANSQKNVKKKSTCWKLWKKLSIHHFPEASLVSPAWLTWQLLSSSEQCDTFRDPLGSLIVFLANEYGQKSQSQVKFLLSLIITSFLSFACSDSKGSARSYAYFESNELQ